MIRNNENEKARQGEKARQDEKARKKEKTPMAHPFLPAGYDLYDTLDMEKDAATFKRISTCTVAVAAVLAIAGGFTVPISAAFSIGWLRVLAAMAAMCIGVVVYVFLHEWVHGVFIRIITGEKAEFGFVPRAGMAYAKSSYFFGRTAYIIVALAPIVVWGIILGVLLADVPKAYFWYLYVIQIFNISGASGDLYVTWRVLTMPRDVLIYDEGTSMKFFGKVIFR